MKYFIKFIRSVKRVFERAFDGRGISFFGGVYHERRLKRIPGEWDGDINEIKNGFRFM